MCRIEILVIPVSYTHLDVYKRQLVYYIRKNEDNLDDLIKQIVQENNSIYKRYQLSEIDVVSETKRIYYIYEKGEVIAKVVVENDGLLKKLSYQWSREKLERNLGG